MPDFLGYGPRLFQGALLTAQLAVWSLLFSVVLGLGAASAKMSASRGLRAASMAYTTIVRGVPDLVMMMLLFYGGQFAVNGLLGAVGGWIGRDLFVDVNPFMAGVVTLALIYGAYMAETFRAAYLAVERGQIEAGLAYGMSRWQVFRRIRFPQMMRHALPGINNNWMVLLKSTALVSIIGLTDMVRVANQATRDTHHPFLFMVPVGLAYLLMTALSELFVLWLQRRYDAGSRERP